MQITAELIWSTTKDIAGRTEQNSPGSTQKQFRRHNMIAFLQGEGSHEGGGAYFWRLKSRLLPPRDPLGGVEPPTPRRAASGEPPLAKSRLVTAPPLVLVSSNILRRRGRNCSSHQISIVAESRISVEARCRSKTKNLRFIKNYRNFCCC